MIVDPWGNVLARAEHEECMMMADVDLDLVKKIREELPSLKNRRADVYTLEVAE